MPSLTWEKNKFESDLICDVAQCNNIIEATSEFYSDSEEYGYVVCSYTCALILESQISHDTEDGLFCSCQNCTMSALIQ